MDEPEEENSSAELSDAADEEVSSWRSRAMAEEAMSVAGAKSSICAATSFAKSVMPWPPVGAGSAEGGGGDGAMIVLDEKMYDAIAIQSNSINPLESN